MELTQFSETWGLKQKHLPLKASVLHNLKTETNQSFCGATKMV